MGTKKGQVPKLRLKDGAAQWLDEERVCSWEGCFTRLSHYRRGTARYCFVHEKVRAQKLVDKANKDIYA